jgi:death-on-curing protein
MSEPLEIEVVTLEDILELHREMINTIGGSHGIKEIGGVEATVAQPQMTFGGEDIYPTLIEKTAALGFSLVKNHGFTDGNKRVGYAAMETFLVLNGFEIVF